MHPPLRRPPPPPDRRSSELDALAVRLAARWGVEDPIEDVYPMSAVQEGMLFHGLASEASDLYLVQQRIRIAGPLQVEHFQRAWSHVVERHTALRTIFVTPERGRPLQVVCRGITVSLEVRDLTTEPSPDAVIETHIESDRARGFVLHEAPLLRIALFRLGSDDHEMLLSQPHLLQDGWSAMNVLSEVFDAYGAFAGGRMPDVKPARPARDFVDWLEARDLSSLEAYWKGQLAGFNNPTRMTRPTGHEGTTDYVRNFRTLAPELTASLRALGREHKVTLSAVLVASLSVLIGRYNRSSDVVFCIVAAGRPPTLPGVESMVGMFINTLPLRIEIAEEARLASWLRYVHGRQAGLLEHEHSPLAEVQSWSELGHGVQLTDTLVAFGNFPTGDVVGEGLSYRTVEGYGRAGFPFSITIEATDPMTIGLHFTPAEFDPARAEQVIDHLVTLLRSMVAGPDTAVGALQMLSDHEIATLTEGLGRGQGPDFPTEASASCVHTLISEQAARTPDAQAAIFGEEALTYRGLEARSNQLARHLADQGLRTGERVSVCLERSLDFLVALLAVHKAGGAFVPLDPAFPIERLRFMMENSESAGLVTTATLLRKAFPAPPRVVVLIDTERRAIEAQPEHALDVEVGPHDVAHVFYTSGSTGRPKGVVVEHGSLTNCLRSLCEHPGFDSTDVVLAVTTPTFDPTLMELFAPLMVGAKVVIAAESTVSHPGALVEALDQWDVTLMFATPSRWQGLLSSGWRGKENLTVLYGGEPMSRELADRLLAGNRALWNLYGTTETTIWSSAGRVLVGQDPITIGDPLSNTWFYILDHRMRPVPDGVPGTLYIGGSGVARGYSGQPELTDLRFLPDPFRPGMRVYDTGDLARTNGQGIECLGRADQQVKVRGHRIELGEVESALAAHPSVLGAAAAVREPRPGDQRLVVYYVLAPAATTGTADLRDSLESWLPDFMLPQHLVELDELPLTPSGKVDRKRLPATTVETATPYTHREPETDSERMVAAVWVDLLGLDKVDLRDNFFDLGGHSLLAMRLMTTLRDRTGVRLDPRVIVLNNLEQLAGRLSSASAVLSGERDHAPQSRTDTARESPSSPATGSFFGPPAEPLFGIHHTPTGPTPRRSAVLVCGPVGWEHTHTHWTLRSLARLAAKQGFHVLRFDYSGIGDSWGDGSASSVDRWAEDVVCAAGHLRSVSGLDDLAIVGIRLGATLASVACSRGLAANRLVLWDPIVNGADFLRSQQHLHDMFVQRRLAGSSSRADAAGPSASSADELLGQPYTRQLRAQVSALDLRKVETGVGQTWLVASTSRERDREMAESFRGSIDYEVIEDAGAWDDRASRGAIVIVSKIPTRVVSLLSDAD